MSTRQTLRHGKVELVLHELREGQGRPLLLLHGLAECSPCEAPPAVAGWPGPVSALDFTGHGESTIPAGGGYSCELLMADADAALRHLGEATVVGRGLGAYVALLLAGARPAKVRGAVLCDGHGLAGGGPTSTTPSHFPVPGGGPPDAFALVELSRDPRPPDYATSFVRQANEISDLGRPLSVCCREQPEWLVAVENEPGVERCTLESALEHYAGI